MRVHVVIRYIGMVLIFLALFMLASAGVSLLNNHDSALYPLLLSAFVTAILGFFPLIFVDRADEIKTKEGYACHPNLFDAERNIQNTAYSL